MKENIIPGIDCDRDGYYPQCGIFVRSRTDNADQDTISHIKYTASASNVADGIDKASDKL